MAYLTTFPKWEIIAEHLRNKLGYSDTTIIRTNYTYNVFVSDYCIFEGGDADSILLAGIKRANEAYENGAISKDKLLRIRRPAFRMVELVQTGTISWKRTPLYGKNMVIVTMKQYWLLILIVSRHNISMLNQ